MADVLDRNFLNDGPLTREFERQVAESCTSVPYAVAVTSGTAAIALALMAKGVGPGDEVIVPDLTFVATANAVRLAGATVVLADVELDRFALSPQSVAERITPRTRAVVPVDVNGRGADYRWLEPFCRQHGLALICDAAEAFGSAFDGRPLGSFGDAACFSFSPNKTVTTGQGGMIVTRHEDVYHRLLELKDQGRRQRGTGGDGSAPGHGVQLQVHGFASGRRTRPTRSVRCTACPGPAPRSMVQGRSRWSAGLNLAGRDGGDRRGSPMGRRSDRAARGCSSRIRWRGYWGAGILVSDSPASAISDR